MIRRRNQITEHEADLWSAFLSAYTATARRAEVDMFLYALFGGRR